MDTSSVRNKKANVWSVKDGDVTEHIVTCTSGDYCTARMNCSTRCTECAVCTHHLTCSCNQSFDASRVLCAHCHLVVIFWKQSGHKVEALFLESPVTVPFVSQQKVVVVVQNDDDDFENMTTDDVIEIAADIT
uniref:SWIM-type domain-containing protein n=1 Tax=Ciona savignyi TaxID=51511 RepID=H2YAM1_CIOSA